MTVPVILASVAIIAALSVNAYSDYKEKQEVKAQQEKIEQCVLKANNNYHDDVRKMGTPMYIDGHDGFGLSIEVQKFLADKLHDETAACKN